MARAPSIVCPQVGLLVVILVVRRYFKQMLRARDSAKKQRLMSKTALSALNLKKPDPSLEARPANITYRPKYVQKQWR